MTPSTGSDYRTISRVVQGLDGNLRDEMLALFRRPYHHESGHRVTGSSGQQETEEVRDFEK
jgi:hypothetical protein